MTQADGMNLEHLDQLVEALSTLVSEAVWPQTEQGEFQWLLARDLLEFATAIQCDARAGRWTTALALGRCLQERADYLLAATIDSGFWDFYQERMQKRIDNNLEGNARRLHETARSIIKRWESKRAGTQGHFDISRRLFAASSELLHHAVGVSWLASDDAETRRHCCSSATSSIRGACAGLLLTLHVSGEDETEAHRSVRALVFGPNGK